MNIGMKIESDPIMSPDGITLHSMHELVAVLEMKGLYEN